MEIYCRYYFYNMLKRNSQREQKEEMKMENNQALTMYPLFFLIQFIKKQK